jgi:hypothetical protein
MQLSSTTSKPPLGMYAASIGERSNEKSGKAIMARQREGDTATFHYQDNLNRAIRYLGRQLVDLLPKVMDSRRMAQVLGEDGSAKTVVIDPQAPEPYTSHKDEQGNTVETYNLTMGAYGVVASAGPSYTTKRQEAAEAQLALVQANPEMWRTHGDLIAKNQDWPGSDEWAKRSRLTLPPELRQDDGDENPELAAAMQQVDQIHQQAQQEISQRDQQIADLQRQLDDKHAESIAKLNTAETGQYKAETERMQVLAPAIAPDQIAQIAQQIVAAIMAQQMPQAPPSFVDPNEPNEPNEPAPAGFFPPEGAY